MVKATDSNLISFNQTSVFFGSAGSNPAGVDALFLFFSRTLGFHYHEFRAFFFSGLHRLRYGVSEGRGRDGAGWEVITFECMVTRDGIGSRYWYRDDGKIFRGI